MSSDEEEYDGDTTDYDECTTTGNKISILFE
jgi:hypothetical protein